MATKNQVRLDYNPALVQGVAELDDKQVNNYQTTAQRLRSDLTYVVPKQWIHSEDVTVNGQKRKSNKIFAIGVDASGNAICVVTMSVNGLRARHYGKVKENPTLRISAVQRRPAEDDILPCMYFQGTAKTLSRDPRTVKDHSLHHRLLLELTPSPEIPHRENTGETQHL
jgi:hypothetical protein